MLALCQHRSGPRVTLSSPTPMAEVFVLRHSGVRESSPSVWCSLLIPPGSNVSSNLVITQMILPKLNGSQNNSEALKFKREWKGGWRLDMDGKWLEPRERSLGHHLKSSSCVPYHWLMYKSHPRSPRAEKSAAAAFESLFIVFVWGFPVHHMKKEPAWSVPMGPQRQHWG